MSKQHPAAIMVASVLVLVLTSTANGDADFRVATVIAAETLHDAGSAAPADRVSDPEKLVELK